jgi:autophagy-related protein 9
VAFIAGSFAAVLFLVSLVDPELFLGFEITKDRTVLFYIGLFGTILAVSRGMIPEDNLVFEPEAMLTQVIEYTHYRPSHWNGRLHSDEVVYTYWC